MRFRKKRKSWWFLPVNSYSAESTLMLMLVLTQVFSCFGKHLICNFHDDFFVKIVDYFSLYRIKHPSNRPLKGAVLL